ncbi:MAG: hypothetical protein D6723_09810 [Acidobacteria bacterium]|nr:MAG: hypothetical protein D6723_09810 [Acidobacteriota bacterium]
MSSLLIAVGGTGQHVALAASRLVFLGALPRMELAIIDSDDSSELASALRTFGGTIEPPYTEHPLINGDKIFSPFDKTEKRDPQFQELFLNSRTPDVEREIFELCFEDRSATLSIKDGMFGRPSVGATVFTYNKKQQLHPIFKAARQADPIFIAGSMVGGTGAGLIHQLVKAIHSEEEGKRLYGLIFLRWFRVPPNIVGQTIDDGTLDRNMRYGLDYFFKDTRSLLKASLLIGVPDSPPADEVKPLMLEAGKTDEKKHYLHVIAAFGMHKLPNIAVTEQTEGSIYAAAFTSAEKMYEESWREKPLHWFVNRARFVNEILKYASSPKFKAELSASFRFFGRKPENVGRGLYEAIAQYDKARRKTVIDEMAKTWSRLSEQYEFSLRWLDDVLGPLPERLEHERYKRVRENETDRVKEIQTLWAKPLPAEIESPEPHEIAKQFHSALVREFA